ncbi:hypothetical protein QFZ75_000139 [Streptomyces sp. V3I8]|nr:hypothetical protein [Streptomyces sp. V3I8]MDQ1033723.1 hypothetical protein [Streptomyces sp. V3I8]
MGVTVSSVQVRSNGTQLADARAAHERAAHGRIRGQIALTVALRVQAVQAVQGRDHIARRACISL